MKEIKPWMGRTQLLLGDEALTKLINKNVLIVGLGGVGGICAEMIARSGVGKMTIIDTDIVEASNRNRQIVALKSTEGKLKSDILKERLLDINPELELTSLPMYLTGTDRFQVLTSQKFDFAIDCIDTLSPKVFFLLACLQMNIPVVSSMGAGGKVDPTQVTVMDISETYNCNLAKYVRKKLRYYGIRDGLKVVFSPEQADKSKIIATPEETRKKSVIGTMSYMPAVFGCTCASVCIRHLYESE
jgi:tRNA A37 threonylcarbamoyladenosine dehydratase